jgi:hypothetical protein
MLCKRKESLPGVVVQACNPSNWGDRGRRIHEFEANLGNISETLDPPPKEEGGGGGKEGGREGRRKEGRKEGKKEGRKEGRKEG